MFDRVIMNIIKVSIEVILVLYHMIPKSILPYPPGAMFISIAPRIGDLEAVEKSRNVLLTVIDNDMKVVGQNDPCDGPSRWPAFPEQFDIAKKDFFPIERYCGDKVIAVIEMVAPQGFHRHYVGFLVPRLWRGPRNADLPILHFLTQINGLCGPSPSIGDMNIHIKQDGEEMKLKNDKTNPFSPCVALEATNRPATPMLSFAVNTVQKTIRVLPICIDWEP